MTPLEGLTNEYGASVNFIYENGDDLEALKESVRKADAVVFVVGYDHDDEGEYVMQSKIEMGGDRKSLRLNENESLMLQEAGPLNPNSVAVLIGGSAIIAEEWKDKINGIIHAFYPGMEGGTAIARILFGDVNPGGKLPFTVAKEESDYPYFDRLATEVTYDRYHGYIRMDHNGKEAAFPFGFGLSYTQFTHDSIDVAADGDKIVASVNVKNSGSRRGEQVVQLYIGFDNSAVEREHKLLKGFERVSLEPGETRRIAITCPYDKIRFYDTETGTWQLEKMEYQVYIGSSSDERDLIKSSFRIN